MDFLADTVVLRMSLAFGVLGFFLALEAWRPFRTPVQSKLQHVATNLVIVGGNAVVVNLLVGGGLLLWSRRVEIEGWGLLNQFGWGSLANILVSVVLLDLIFFGNHWANHHVPFLWRFHRAHHSDLDVDVSTGLRFHLGEVLISMGVKGVSIVALGVSPVGFIISEIAILAAVQFQHTNVSLPKYLETPIRTILVTPYMHWVHHSCLPQEHNSNFGTMLSGWDRLFGTYFMEVRREEIRLGLDEYSSPDHIGIIRFYLMPWGPKCRRIP